MANKPMWKRVLGDWNDLKRGFGMGKAVSQKPQQWLTKKGEKLGKEEIEKRLKKYKRKVIVISLIILALWLGLMFGLTSLALWKILVPAAGVVLYSWFTYRYVAKGARGEAGKKKEKRPKGSS